MEWILYNWEIIVALIVSPLITWVFVKRHYQKRDLKDKDVIIESNQSDVVSKNLDLYQKMLDDIEMRYEEKLKKRDLEIEFLEKEVAELKERLKLLENR